MGGRVGLAVFDRHRKWVLIALGTLMIASTSLVSNQRALFRPVGAGPILAAAVPQAYAMIIPGNRGRSVSRSGGGSDGGDTNPSAFGLRLPPAPTRTGLPSQSSFTPLPDLAMIDGAAATAPAGGFPGANLIGFPGSGYGDPGAGGGLPGGSPGGTSPGGGGGPIGGPTPAVPEPTSWVMLLFGIGAIGAFMRRANRSSRAARPGHLSNAQTIHGHRH